MVFFFSAKIVIMDSSYYRRSSIGHLEFDRGQGSKYFLPWWCALKTDDGITALYRWLSKRHGVPVARNGMWGAHVSVIKGDEPELNKDLWGTDFGPIKFYYSTMVRYDNGCHAWLDVYCERLGEIRELFGLPNIDVHGEHPRHYHMTLGRWAHY